MPATPLTMHHSTPPRPHQVQEKGGSGTSCSLLETSKSQLFSSGGNILTSRTLSLLLTDVSLALNFQGKDKNPTPGISGVAGLGGVDRDPVGEIHAQTRKAGQFLAFFLSLPLFLIMEGKEGLHNDMRSLQINAVNM